MLTCELCSEEAEDACYIQFNWIDDYLNRTSTKKAIGVPSNVSFTLINKDVNTAFHARGDSVRNSAVLLPELINSGVRLLVYAGMAGASFITFRQP